MLVNDVNAMIWGKIMSATLKAAVHLGTRSSRESAYHQEHRLRKGQTVVRHFTEIDPESK